MVTYIDWKAKIINPFKGADDIKNHRWFKEVNYDVLLQKKVQAPYKPVVRYINIKFYLRC